jgi:NitT/TauT family transport system permease protein
MSNFNNGDDKTSSGVIKIAPLKEDEVRTISAIQRFWIKTQGFFYPFFTLVMLVALTEAIVRGFGIRDFVLPAPSQVYQTLIASWSYLWTNTQPTLMIILLGFSLSL